MTARDAASSEWSTTSARAIRQHYDIGNTFYALWLDEQMVYSCALWSAADETLEAAQSAKLRYHADAVLARPGGRYLDVGCGWGAMLGMLATKFQCREVIGLTLSEAQRNYAIQRYGQHPNVHVKLASWQEFVDEQEFDGITSIGAFEHFGRCDQSIDVRQATYARFFDFCRRRLPQGGRLSLQSISYGRMRTLPPFIRESIWPESELPMAAEILQASARWFEVERLVNHRADYARTSRAWRARLERNRAQAADLVGKVKVEEYLRYLDMSAAAFEGAGLQLLRIVFRKTTK